MRLQRIPKVNERVKYHLPKSDEWIQAKVINGDGKATERNRYDVVFL